MNIKPFSELKYESIVVRTSENLKKLTIVCPQQNVKWESKCKNIRIEYSDTVFIFLDANMLLKDVG